MKNLHAPCPLPNLVPLNSVFDTFSHDRQARIADPFFEPVQYLRAVQ
jgi:hypothetical protein